MTGVALLPSFGAYDFARAYFFAKSGQYHTDRLAAMHVAANKIVFQS